MKERILIVDDDPLICEGLYHVLKDKYEAATAKSGKEAIELIKKQDFEVILTDLVMPGINGMQILKEVKASKPQTRVVMITAYATVNNAVEAMKEGASDYISKPFELADVESIIKRALREAKFERERAAIERKLRLEQVNLELNKDVLLKTLSSPIRREVLEFLSSSSHSFTEILKELKIEDPTKLSFHLRLLKAAKLIRQDEARIYYLTREGWGVTKILKYLGNVLKGS